ncbi:MAG: hypothetical protein KAJ98_07070 [Spirochaetaceae bacterium]|nr:hypothetical protein [Spirochaetaceae bacterium]
MILALFIRKIGLLHTVSHPSIFVPFIAVVLFFSTRQMDHAVVRIIHVFCITVVASISIIEGYESFYGLGFMILAVLLSYKYGFLEKGFKWKAGISIIVVLLLIEISVFLSDEKKAGVGIDVILFLIFFLVFVYIIYQEEINHLASSNKKLEKSLYNLITEKSRLERELSEKTRMIEDCHKQIEQRLQEDKQNIESFKHQFKLTTKELEIVLLIYNTGNHNKQIAEDLGITTGTIKQHLSRIYNKMDVSNRSQMMLVLREFLTD